MDPQQLITAVPLLAAVVAALVILLREIRKNDTAYAEQLKAVGVQLAAMNQRLLELEVEIAYFRGERAEADRSGGYQQIGPRRKLAKKKEDQE